MRPAQATWIGSLQSTISLAHAQHVVERALRAAGQADVGDVDAELVHQVQELELVLDVRVVDATGSAGRRAASRRRT